MDLYSLREQLKSRSIYDLPLRVTFYARVSTDKDEQATSIRNQDDYFVHMIHNVPNWRYYPGFVDEGISGTSVNGRVQFLRMIEEAKAHKFDLILTKEVSRFARNTLDSLTYTRELLREGIGVYFVSDNINTLDPDSELRLIIMSGIAQDESRKISSRVKFGAKQAIKNGRIYGSNRIYGYDYVDKGLIINEAQAAFVRDLYERFATGSYSLNQLEKYYYAQGLRGIDGGKINPCRRSFAIPNTRVGSAVEKQQSAILLKSGLYDCRRKNGSCTKTRRSQLLCLRSFGKRLMRFFSNEVRMSSVIVDSTPTPICFPVRCTAPIAGRSITVSAPRALAKRASRTVPGSARIKSATERIPALHATFGSPKSSRRSFRCSKPSLPKPIRL